MEHVPRRSSFSIRARSSRLPLSHQPYPSTLPYTSPALLLLLLLLLLLFLLFSSLFRSSLSASIFFRILPRHPYRKCIYVLCKASNRRWPREPDARRVINTDALVPSLSSSLPFPLLYPLFISFRCSPLSSFFSSRNHWITVVCSFRTSQVCYKVAYQSFF